MFVFKAILFLLSTTMVGSLSLFRQKDKSFSYTKNNGDRKFQFKNGGRNRTFVREKNGNIHYTDRREPGLNCCACWYAKDCDDCNRYDYSSPEYYSDESTDYASSTVVNVNAKTEFRAKGGLLIIR